jgi:hypothetical protein
MEEFGITSHAKRMLSERNITQDWVIRTISKPLRIENKDEN